MKKGQSVIEYAVLVAIVAAAFIAMSVYINRAVNSRLHDLEIETNPPVYVRE